MMDAAEIARLREIAAIAANQTPGGWETIFQGTRREEVTAVAEDGEIVLVCVLTDPDDAAHIAAFDPTTTLALLDELAQARKERDSARALLREADLQMDYFGGRWPTGTTPAIRSRIEAELRK